MSFFQQHFILGSLFETPQRYTDLSPISTGVSGIVCSATDLITSKTVAIEKLADPFQSVQTTHLFLREIRLLRQLKHDNVVNLTDIFISPSEDIYLCTEHMRFDLATCLKNGPLDEKFAKFFFYQIMRGLKYVHSAGVVHRDLKPKNILIQPNCDLKISDFGMARVLHDMRETGYVSTRYYRAPEIMLSWKDYNEKVDIWSAACIFVEMILGRPLFPGQNHIDQFRLMTELRGKPQPHELERITNKNTLGIIDALPRYRRKPLAAIIPNIDRKAIDLLDKILVYDPDSRPSAREILESPYFAEYHDPSDEPEAPGVLDWSSSEGDLPLELLKIRMYSEVVRYHALPELPKAGKSSGVSMIDTDADMDIAV